MIGLNLKEIANAYAEENWLIIEYFPKGGACCVFKDTKGNVVKKTRQELYRYQISKIPEDKREPWMRGY